jgi:hypothetical protein
MYRWLSFPFILNLITLLVDDTYNSVSSATKTSLLLAWLSYLLGATNVCFLISQLPCSQFCWTQSSPSILFSQGMVLKKWWSTLPPRQSFMVCHPYLRPIDIIIRKLQKSKVILLIPFPRKDTTPQYSFQSCDLTPFFLPAICVGDKTSY